MGFFVTGNRGTLRGPPRCNTVDACMKLYNGMKGIGTDEAAILDVVSVHNSKQRQQIRKKYSQVYKKDLLKELDGELSFGFGKLVAALMLDPEELTLESLHRAVCQQSRGGKLVKRLSAMFKEGLGKTEYSILSLLFPRTNKQLEQIKEAFSAKYNLDLDERIAMGGNDLPQDLCTLLLDMLSGERQEEEEVDPDQVEEDTDNLVGASGCEDAFQQMMQERSFIHLKAVFEQYMEVTGRGIENFVEDSDAFSLELKEAYKAMLLLLTYEPEFYADRLRQAIQGAGTDDETLIRVIVLRSEVDMIDIVECYERKFGISLADDICGDTSGDYQALLLKIISVPEEEKEVKKPVRRAVAKKAVKKEDEEVEVKAITEVKQMRRVAKSKALKKATPSPTPPEEEVQDEGVEEEEPAVEKKPIRKAVRSKPVKKATPSPPPPEEEDGEVEVDEEPEVETKPVRKVAKPKPKVVKKVTPPPPEEEEDDAVEDDEEPEVEKKPMRKVAKPKPKVVKKVTTPPPEEQSEVEEEEETPVVVPKKKVVKKVAKPQPKVEVETDEEGEEVEEEVAATVNKEIEAAVEVDPPEEEADEVAAEEEVQENDNENTPGAEEEEVKPEETPEDDAKNTEEDDGDERVIIVVEADDDASAEPTGNAAKIGQDIEGSAVSPVISREL